MLIELAQLVSFHGLFEIDDVIHNALETAVGVLLVLGMRRLVRRFHPPIHTIRRNPA